ncbi:response regulator transcription factor [Lichenibacterium minor]|uniref:Response regulator transcription factor n=1 Tax=Lichenibacterium minor TaxID=2316528 RepID=A0A4Q2U892_9HYPH|nr:response regulator transcription factor [Lichenibacterium minor]RYC31351.1 response regulator transcription factor [Lichenibacterium minor]
MAKLLLIEDDDVAADAILGDLRERGFAAERAATGPLGLDRARAERWDVLVVDRMLPGRGGLSILHALRCEGDRVPALVLSALDSVDDRVDGLRAGGDDYLVKPFSLVELAARVEALLRRPAELPQTWLRLGSLELNLGGGTARRGQRPLDLLPREFKLLEYLARRHGQVITRAMLFEDVWRYGFVPKSNLVDVHVGRLRRKLDGPGEAPIIENVRGVGFILHAPR